jgi:hypothetical protein
LLAAVDDRLHPRHRLVMGDAGLVRRHAGFDRRAEPGVIGFGLFGRSELGLDGGELDTSKNRWRLTA